MSTPIFDQLAAEFAAKGKQYEKLVKPIPTGLPKRVRPYVAPQSTMPVVVPLHVLQAIQETPKEESKPKGLKGVMAPGMYIDEWQMPEKADAQSIPEEAVTQPIPVYKDSETVSFNVVKLPEGVKAYCPPGAGAEALKTFLEKHGHRITEDQRRLTMLHPEAVSARVEKDGAVVLSFDPAKTLEGPSALNLKPLSERNTA
jgi:hypothetical protein